MKELISLFKEIAIEKAIIICISAFSILLPGILFIYVFNPVVFSGEILKTQVLSSAISFGLQLILWVTFLFYFLQPIKTQLLATRESFWMAILFAAILCSGELLIVSFIKIWVGVNFKAIHAISICTVTNLFFLCDASFDQKQRRRALINVQ